MRRQLIVAAAIGLAMNLATAPADAAQCVSMQVNSPNPGSQANALGGVSGTSSSDVWAVGVYFSQAAAVKSLILHWDGASWSIVSSPKPAPGSVFYYSLNGVAAISPTNAWSVGQYRVTSQSTIEPLTEHWDGSRWRIVTNPAGASGTWLGTVAAVPNSQEVWAGGVQTWPVAWHWDGAQWNSMVVPAPDARAAILASISAVAPNDVWAVGSEWNAFKGPRGFVDHWNGSTWSKVPIRVSEPYYAFNEIVARTSTDVWLVGGETTMPSSYYNHVLVEHWDGTKWRQVSVPDPSGQNPTLNGISALSKGNVWVSGSVLPNGNQSQTVVEHWDGSSWSVLSTPIGSLGRTAGFPYDVWSVGSSNGNAATLTVLSHC